MNKDMVFAIVLLITGGLVTAFSSSEWGGWLIGIGLVLGIIS